MQNWVSVVMDAEGRFSVGFDAIQLDNVTDTDFNDPYHSVTFTPEAGVPDARFRRPVNPGSSLQRWRGGPVFFGLDRHLEVGWEGCIIPYAYNPT